MILKINTYSLLEFLNQYGTEADCEKALFHLKWHKGDICSKCSHKHYYTISTRQLHLYQCKCCGHQQTVTTSTIMQNSKLSLTVWFLALYFHKTRMAFLNRWRIHQIRLRRIRRSIKFKWKLWQMAFLGWSW